MDRTLTSGEVARALGVSVPTIHRAVKAGIVPAVRAPNGRLRFDGSALVSLRRLWGWCPEVPGLSRAEARVLAALSRRPLGLRSTRAVARAAGVSPTTASRCLRALSQRGYAARRRVQVAEGRAREAGVWTIRWGKHPWLDVASEVGRCVLPDVDGRSERRVPRRLAHLFWNADVNKLDPVRDGHYIADRILRNGDAQGLAWMARVVPSFAIAAAGRGRGLDARRAALARVLAA